RVSQLGKGRTSQWRFECQRLAGGDEAEWPSHRVAALAARAWNLLRGPIGTIPLPGQSGPRVETGEGQWWGCWNRWHDHRPVPRLCPPTLGEDSFAPLSRHVPSGAGAPRVPPQAQWGLAPPGQTDGPGPCHPAGDRAAPDAYLRPALQPPQLWVSLRKAR